MICPRVRAEFIHADVIAHQIWVGDYDRNFFFDYGGIVQQHAVEPDTTVNGSYYANVLRTKIQHVKRKRPLLRNGFLSHHDNARPHIARCVLDVSQQNNVKILPQPPYSPDKTPCDFQLFLQLKKPLRGKRFASNKACVKAVEANLIKISQNGLLHVFKQWTERWDTRITFRGSYTAGQLLRTHNTILHSNHKMKGSKMWKIRISAEY
ncbi:histone-lysine N-methyltransferase SETMAR [Trichonephila clavipes]|uniref:Histone-lysine N-methyltransferase SETMAR n=1 Tax=Trichonephila clavipes TaxID=2585209 RepID=A0A8X6W484_TRICX|nr:histone-lysine N-methyltransferase SETMAR [Trichonephila clavipes]